LVRAVARTTSDLFNSGWMSQTTPTYLRPYQRSTQIALLCFTEIYLVRQTSSAFRVGLLEQLVVRVGGLGGIIILRDESRKMTRARKGPSARAKPEHHKISLNLTTFAS
jgi:hypothetical protein